jgi:hypothetical protein
MGWRLASVSETPSAWESESQLAMLSASLRKFGLFYKGKTKKGKGVIRG